MPRSKLDFTLNDCEELCFDPNTFLKESFSIDEFLRNNRNKATLEVLRNDLGTYLKTLRLSMIELINKDYEDFVNLSQDLVGLNNGIAVLQDPLDQVRSEIVVVKNKLEHTIAGLQQCLEQDRLVKEKKQSLFHLAQVLTSLEKLKGLMKGNETTDRSLGLDHIERASAEYTMLHFSVSKCRNIMSRTQKEDCERLEIILMDLLNKSFLEYLRKQDSSRLLRCLRIFANLDKVAEAERLIRKEVVAPYLYDLVNESTLHKEPGGLKSIYGKVLDFVNSQLQPLLELKAEGGARFDFLINGLWVELAQRVELHTSSVFAAGDPSAFHTRFTDTCSFLDALRHLCDSPAALDSHPQTVQFMQKWNLLVYYKIRFQEIAGQLECAMSDGLTPAGDGHVYVLKVPAVAVMCVQRCWGSEVFIFQLAPVFWRLSLQILARYCVWVREETSKDNMVESSVVGRTTPNFISAHSTHNSHLHQLVCLHLDTERFTSECMKLLTDARVQLPSSSNCDTKVSESLKESSRQLLSVLSCISEVVVRLLVRESVVPLANIKDIPRLFRRTNRDTPTKPCEYVQHVLQPLTYFYNNNKHVSEEVLQNWIVAVLCEVSQQFHSSVIEVLESAQKTEESLRRLKKAKDKYVNSGENKGTSDDDKIRQQLVVDVHTYRNGVEALSIDSKKIALLNELVLVVESARDKSERQ